MLGNTVKDGSGDAWHILIDSNGRIILAPTSTVIVAGGEAHDAAASSNPLRIAGVYRATAPAVADGDIVDLLMDAAGRATVLDGGVQEGQILASAARTATVNSDDQVNPGAKGVIVYVNVTAVSATPSVTPKLQYKIPNTSTYVDAFTAGAAITATGQYVYVLYPGNLAIPASGTGVTQLEELPLPKTWRWVMTHADADSITYSVERAYVR